MAVAIAACSTSPGGRVKRVAVFSAIGEPQAGSTVYRHDATGALRATAVTDASGVASLPVHDGDTITAIEVDSIVAPMRTRRITVAGFDDVGELRVGGIALARTAIGQTAIRTSGLGAQASAFVTTSCDATTLGPQQPSASFGWYRECESATRMTIGVSSETPPRYASASAVADAPLVLDGWSALPETAIAVPGDRTPIELAVEIFDGARGVRRFFIESSTAPFAVAPIGRWHPEVTVLGPDGEGSYWSAAVDPGTPIAVPASDLAAPDRVEISATRIVHHGDRALARRTDVAYGDPCIDGSWWTVIDDAGHDSFALPALAAEPAAATGYATLVLRASDLSAGDVIAQLASASPAPDAFLLATGAPVSTTLFQSGLHACD